MQLVTSGYLKERVIFQVCNFYKKEFLISELIHLQIFKSSIEQSYQTFSPSLRPSLSFFFRISFISIGALSNGAVRSKR